VPLLQPQVCSGTLMSSNRLSRPSRSYQVFVPFLPFAVQAMRPPRIAFPVSDVTTCTAHALKGFASGVGTLHGAEDAKVRRGRVTHSVINVANRVGTCGTNLPAVLASAVPSREGTVELVHMWCGAQCSSRVSDMVVLGSQQCSASEPKTEAP
jgi:hypothetical protein